MATYDVGIARTGTSVHGWVFALAGCRAVGGSVDEVVGLLPIAIAEHVAWLGGHGESVPEASGVEFKMIEDVDTQGEFVYEADKRPMSTEEVEQAIRRIGYAFDDLMGLAGPLTGIVQDWKPPASSVKIDNIYPDVRTIREMLVHATGSLAFFSRNVGEAPPAPPAGGAPAGPPPDPAVALETAVTKLRSLTDAERSTVYRRVNQRGLEGEWTARKLVRRMVNHLRFHAREIEQRLSWLVLGVPEVLPVNRE